MTEKKRQHYEIVPFLASQNFAQDMNFLAG